MRKQVNNLQFEYYVLNYDRNRKQVEQFNIFNNSAVQHATEMAIKKYIRSPKNYKHMTQLKNTHLGTEEEAIYGFDALCKKIRSILMWQLWSRREYEISVTDAFAYDVSDFLEETYVYDTIDEVRNALKKIDQYNPKLEKLDCFTQCEKNIPAITRECIYQYKRQLKKKDK